MHRAAELQESGRAAAAQQQQQADHAAAQQRHASELQQLREQLADLAEEVDVVRLPGLVAHELAHNLLRHRAWFDAYGKRTRKGVRLTEREADRLSPWLLANAGLDPDGGAMFFKRWGPRHGMWIFRDRDHDAWDERVDNMAAEIPQIESLMASEGAADWPRHFRREKLPSR